MTEHTFSVSAAQQEALEGVATHGGITVQDLIESQILTRFLPEIENQYRQQKRDAVANAYEKASPEKKSQIDAIVADIKDAEAEASVI